MKTRRPVASFTVCLIPLAWVSKATVRRRWLRSCRRQPSDRSFLPDSLPGKAVSRGKIERSYDLYKAKVRKLMFHFQVLV